MKHFCGFFEDLELNVWMRHCLAVKTKVEQVVTIDAHLGLSLFEGFQGQHPQHFERFGTSSSVMKIRMKLLKVLKQAFEASLLLIRQLKISMSC
jgi:hypothetical protein